MKTGFVIAVIGVLGVFGILGYCQFISHAPFGDFENLLAVFSGIVFVVGLLIMQFNDSRRDISKTQNILGLITGVVGIVSAIIFISASPIVIFFLCFLIFFFALFISGICIPEPLTV